MFPEGTCPRGELHDILSSQSPPPFDQAVLSYPPVSL
jgi:hypothetical protein